MCYYQNKCTNTKKKECEIYNHKTLFYNKNSPFVRVCMYAYNNICTQTYMLNWIIFEYVCLYVGMCVGVYVCMHVCMSLRLQPHRST